MYCVPARLAPPGVRHCGHPREEENEHISSAYHIPNPMSKGVCGHRIDLAERRRIRSAIRELQRQELEREEEALASKRFRAERQDNKENWLQ